MNKRLILIDGHALFHRAFHALPPFRSPKGEVVNAIYGFLSILLRTIKDVNPDYIVATFDLATKTFRHEEFEEYKAHREAAPDEMHDQLPRLKEVLESFGIPIYEAEGYEADDVIGTIAEKLKREKDVQVVILTGDLDTLQLVDDEAKITVFTPKKGVSDSILYNEKAVIERFGLRPDQMIDYKGLRGDPSDNIPGVPGVGDKTASTLLKKYENIETLYEALERGQAEDISEKMKEKLLTNKDKAFLSKKIATIIRDVKIKFDLDDADWQKHYKAKHVEDDLKDLGFFSILERLPHREKDKKIDSEAKIELTEGFDTEKVNDYFVFNIVGKSVYISLDSKTVYKTDLKSVKELFEKGGIEKIGHGLKPLLKKLISLGIRPEGPYFDTAIAAYLINPGRRDYSLERVYFAKFAKSLTVDDRLHPALIWELRELVIKELKGQGVWDVARNIEMPLIEILAEMERKGIKIDLKSLEELAKAVDKEVGGIKKEIYRLAGEEFNISSPKQLAEVLYKKMGIRGRIRKTTGGSMSTAASELEKIRGEHEIVDHILKYRELQKLKTTYIDPFPSLVASDDRLHTTYHQTITATGRLASSDPNLQNIPVRTELGQKFRGSFVAGKGYKLVAFDYSQFELRILAHISEDRKLIRAFKEGDDIHLRTASEVFNVGPEQVTSNMRRQAKVLNFGIIYGMGARGFAQAAGIPVDKAKQFIDCYFDEFEGVSEYINETKKKAHDEGFVATLFGRKRELPDINTSIPMLVSQAERMAVNLPIQGTQADLIKMAMISVHKHLKDKYSNDEAKMLLQIHDELVFEIKEDSVQEISKEIKKIMESMYKLKVPIIVDAKEGDNWAEMERMRF